MYSTAIESSHMNALKGAVIKRLGGLTFDPTLTEVEQVCYYLEPRHLRKVKSDLENKGYLYTGLVFDPRGLRMKMEYALGDNQQDVLERHIKTEQELHQSCLAD